MLASKRFKFDGRTLGAVRGWPGVTPKCVTLPAEHSRFMADSRWGVWSASERKARVERDARMKATDASVASWYLPWCDAILAARSVWGPDSPPVRW